MDPKSLIVHFTVDVSFADEQVPKMLTRAILSGSEDDGDAAAVQNSNHISLLGPRWSKANKFVMLEVASIGGGTTNGIASEEGSVPGDSTDATKVVVYDVTESALEVSTVL